MDKNDLLDLATFNKLSLTAAEMDAMVAYFAFALTELAKMAEVDCRNVPPLVHCLTQTNVFREDVVAQVVSREAILANAPTQSQGCFQVPMVVE